MKYFYDKSNNIVGVTDSDLISMDGCKVAESNISEVPLHHLRIHGGQIEELTRADKKKVDQKIKNLASRRAREINKINLEAQQKQRKLDYLLEKFKDELKNIP